MCENEQKPAPEPEPWKKKVRSFGPTSGGSRIAAMQKHKNILSSLAAVIHKNEPKAAGNSEKVMQPWTRLYRASEN